MRYQDDPEQRLEKLQGRWVIRERLEIGHLVDGIRIIRCPYIAIQWGDFVEVQVEVTIVTAGPRHHVQFSLQQIIRVQEKTIAPVS